MRSKALALAMLVLALAGCTSYSEANSHNAPKPAKTYVGSWVRIGTPGTYPTLVFECFGTDGVFVANDSYTSAFVVRDDPHCGGKP